MTCVLRLIRCQQEARTSLGGSHDVEAEWGIRSADADVDAD